MSYQRPAGVFETELVVKKSRFIARVVPVVSRQALDQAPAETRRELLRFTASADFSVEQALRHFLTAVQGQLLSVDYRERVMLEVAVPAEQADSLAVFCAAHAIDLQDTG